MVALLDKSRFEIKLGDYGVGQATALSDPTLLPKVQEYRRLASARMQPLDREGISEKIPAADYHVSRKVDGEFTVLIFRDGQAFSMNPGGTVRVGLPWMEEAAKLFSKAKIKEAIIAGELYVAREDRRPRVHDVSTVARQPQSASELGQLRFAVFDIMSLDGAAISQPYANTWKTIVKIFGEGATDTAGRGKPAKDAGEITAIFEDWVDKQDAEGIVVRSDLAGMFKIKPRHHARRGGRGLHRIGRRSARHDARPAAGGDAARWHVASAWARRRRLQRRAVRRDMLSDLKDMVVESEYAEVNADHVAYQMVQPRMGRSRSVAST